MTNKNPSQEACQRCIVLEDLLETATSERDKARDESRKADEETLALKVRDVGIVAKGMTGAYAAIKAFQHRAEEAEAKLEALNQTSLASREVVVRAIKAASSTLRCATRVDDGLIHDVEQAILASLSTPIQGEGGENG